MYCPAATTSTGDQRTDRLLRRPQPPSLIMFGCRPSRINQDRRCAGVGLCESSQRDVEGSEIGERTPTRSGGTRRGQWKIKPSGRDKRCECPTYPRGRARPSHRRPAGGRTDWPPRDVQWNVHRHGQGNVQRRGNREACYHQNSPQVMRAGGCSAVTAAVGANGCPCVSPMRRTVMSWLLSHPATAKHDLPKML